MLINRANDGRGVERLERYFVRQLRTWRPDVVVTHFIAEPDAHPLESIVQRMVDQSLRAAADPNQYVDLASNVGLDPWAVKKFYGVLPTGWRGQERITTGQFAPRLGTTLADWAEPSRRLLRGMPTAAPDAIDLQLIAASDGVPQDESHDMFAGIRLAPGSDARRRLANLPGEDIEKLRRLATRRRQMRMLVEQSQGNAAWAAQVSHLTDDLDPESAGELLFELAEGYRAAGKLDLAADTYSSLARSRPEHPAVEPALRWLVQFYASGETARRLESRDAQNFRVAPTAEVSANAVQQASAGCADQRRLGPGHGAVARQSARAGQSARSLSGSARPSLYADPSVRFPLVVAERKLGFANPAQRYFLTLKSLPENDPWRRCAQTEEWFAQPGESPPAKQLGNCRSPPSGPTSTASLTNRSGSPPTACF